MSKTYVSIKTNASKLFSYKFLMGIMIMVAISLLFDLAIYGIFSTGTQAAWTKAVVSALVVAEAVALYKFWNLIRG